MASVPSLQYRILIFFCYMQVFMLPYTLSRIYAIYKHKVGQIMYITKSTNIQNMYINIGF